VLPIIANFYLRSFAFPFDLTSRHCLDFPSCLVGIPQDLAEELQHGLTSSGVSELMNVPPGNDEGAAQLVVGAFEISGHDG
jgi:hypothetical protein